MDHIKYTSFLIYLVAATCGEYANHRPVYQAGRSRCQVVECDPGEEAKLCSLDSQETTRCVPCDPDTFMNRSTKSEEGRRCQNKRVCSRNEGLILWKENDATKNRQCLCNTSLGYYSVDFDPTDPEYSTESCVYCPWNDSYIDPHIGCSTCPGLIYLDSGGYKRCRKHKQNTSTPAETPTASVRHVRSDVSVAEETEGKGAVPSASSTSSQDSYSSSHIGVIVGVVVGFIVVVCLVILTHQCIKRQNANRRSRQERDVTPEWRPVLTDTEPSPSIRQTCTRPLLQATDTGSLTTAYNLVSEGPTITDIDGANTKDSVAKPAENGGLNIHCEYYIPNGDYVKISGDYNRMSAKGNIENSVIGQRLDNGHTTDSSAGDPQEVTINIRPARADTLDSNENLSDSVDTIHSVVGRTAHPIQEVADNRLPSSDPVPETEPNENTRPKQL